MKKLLITTIALTAIGVAVRAKAQKKNKFSITVTNLDDELLADITEENIIYHDDIKVYFDNNLIS